MFFEDPHFREYLDGKLSWQNPKPEPKKELPLKEMLASLFLLSYGVRNKDTRALLLNLPFVARIVYLSKDHKFTPKFKTPLDDQIAALIKDAKTHKAHEVILDKAIVDFTKSFVDVRQEKWFQDYVNKKMAWQTAKLSNKSISGIAALNLLNSTVGGFAGDQEVKK